MKVIKGCLIAATMSMTASSAHGEYTLKISKGKFPEGVRIENLNGCQPETYAYKKVSLDQAWASGDYGKRINVALSPSFMKKGETCENALSLPLMKIEEGEWLIWEGCEVYPLFKETYTVEAMEAGSGIRTIIGEYHETENDWTKHMADLSSFSGKDVEIRFVCRSTDGYMLALAGISILKPEAVSFDCENLTPKFFAAGELEEETATVKFTLTNTGVSVSGVTVGLADGDEVLSELHEEEEWKTGETKAFQLPLPLTLNVRRDYRITVETTDTDKQTVSESFAYCTSFKRHLLVDKGTGMWCNSCPDGTLAMQELKKEYGDAVIGVETHNDDPLANEINFTWLRFYSIPTLMLNRIRKTAGDGTYKFDDYILEPVDMQITVDGLIKNEDNTLTAKATVMTSDSFSATDRIYRIGYVLTRDFTGEESTAFYQKNIFNIASYKQYYYLPSMIPYTLCHFSNVSLVSPLASISDNVAFTGIEGSLPETLECGSSYECSWDIPLPEGYTNFDGMRLVAYVLDAGNYNVVNSTMIETGDTSEVKLIGGNAEYCTKEGVYSIDGRKITGAPERGIYIVGGKKVIF